MKVPGMILAGGLSRRMEGRDKALVTLAGRPMIAHVISRLEPQLTDLAINANGDPERLARFGVPVLADSLPDHPGPLAGILAAMDWAATLGADRVLTVSADTPFLPGDFAPRLLLASESTSGPVLAASMAPEAGGDGPRVHPTCALWPVTLRTDLRDALHDGQRKVLGWAEAEGADRVEFPAPGLDPFFNVNTPGDLARAEALLAG